MYTFGVHRTPNKLQSGHRFNSDNLLSAMYTDRQLDKSLSAIWP